MGGHRKQMWNFLNVQKRIFFLMKYLYSNFSELDNFTIFIFTKYLTKNSSINFSWSQVGMVSLSRSVIWFSKPTAKFWCSFLIFAKECKEISTQIFMSLELGKIKLFDVSTCRLRFSLRNMFIRRVIPVAKKYR